MAVLDSPVARQPRRWLGVGMVALLLVLLAATLAAPFLLEAADPGDALVRYTVRLSLAYYTAAATLMLLLRPEEWRLASRGRLARCCWSLAWAAYLVHLGMAFHFAHHWSHADALQHTEQRSGFGPGIFLSHLFTLAWTADVLWWWLRPAGYAFRPRWVDGALHGFMAFIIFNATVVYEEGPIRWAGLLLFAELAAVAVYRWTRPGLQGNAWPNAPQFGTGTATPNSGAFGYAARTRPRRRPA